MPSSSWPCGLEGGGFVIFASFRAASISLARHAGRFVIYWTQVAERGVICVYLLHRKNGEAYGVRREGNTAVV